MQYLSTKLGIVLLVLGVMHFFNLFILSSWRRRALRNLLPEVVPAGHRRNREDRDYLGGLRSMAVPVDEEVPPRR